MPEANAQEIDANLTAWYASLQLPNGPTTTAAAYAALGAELRAKGNPNNTGPQFLLCNTGQGQLHLLSSIIERPANIPNMPATSPFAQTPYLAILGNRTTPEDDWTYGHITPDDLFGPRSDRLAAWANIKAPPRNDTGVDIGRPRNGNPKAHHPMLPLYGKDICTKMIQLLYPPNAEDRATIKAASYALKEYVDAIPTEETKQMARASLLGLVTRSTPGNQAGTTDFGTAAGDEPGAKAALKAWAGPLVDKTLDPRSPVVRFILPADEAGLTTTSPGLAADEARTDPPMFQALDPGTATPTASSLGLGAATPGDPDYINRFQAPDPGTAPPTASSLGRSAATPGDPDSHTDHYDLSRATYDSILTCTRGNPRLHGRPPSTQPRLSPDAGFNTLSDFKKCQLLTYAKVATADMLKSHLKELLEVDKADRLGWFNVNIMPLLKDRDAEAFAGFHYTAEFVDQLCTVELTAPSVESWWDTPFVGGQLYRSKEDIQHLNRLHRTRGQAQVQLQISPQQLGTLSSKAPVPITNLPDLLNFLKRVWHCSTLFFPQCDLGHLAKDIYQALLDQHRALSGDPTWLSIKPGEIVHRLQQANNAEFGHLIPLHDILDGNLAACYHPPSHASIVSQCLAPTPTIAQGFLPLELRQRQLPHHPQAPAPATPNRGTSSGTPPDPNTRSTGGTPNRDIRGNPGQPVPHENTRYHPNFRAFWTALPQVRRRDPIGRWLSLAGSTTNQMLETLGLSPHDCGRFHIKGRCSGSCTRQHTSKTLDSGKVDAVIALFHAGLQHAS